MRTSVIKLSSLLLLFGLFSRLDSWAQTAANQFEIPAFEKVAVPLYIFPEFEPMTALRMDYAESKILNPEAWQRMQYRVKVKEIDLVFTQYPVDTAKWKTAYNELIESRIQSLFRLDPGLRNSDIKWRLVLQTNCPNQAEAKKQFHGFVIKYKVTKPSVISIPSTVWDIEKMLSGFAIPADSSIMGVLDRNKDWSKVLVIMDWTGSMYGYGAQVLLWHKLNLEQSGIKHFVFFNDGDHKRNWQKTIGSTGGIYYSESDDMPQLLETMSIVMENGWGGDRAENDLEAVLRGILLLNDYEEVVLIADNDSPVRDMQLLKAINKPVRIVVCGASGNAKIQKDYLEIAFQTKGSLHTVDEDIVRMADLKEGEMINIHGTHYQVVRGRLEFIY